MLMILQWVLWFAVWIVTLILPCFLNSKALCDNVSFVKENCMLQFCHVTAFGETQWIQWKLLFYSFFLENLMWKHQNKTCALFSFHQDQDIDIKASIVDIFINKKLENGLSNSPTSACYIPHFCGIKNIYKHVACNFVAFLESFLLENLEMTILMVK